jgi:Pyruvate/2-oxoacid:ferredoxin oxidoreductase delta subunit/DNA-binding Lrp family transcriptional regulator
MTTGNEVYVEVAEKLGGPASERVLRLLEAYFSPEEGKVLLELFEPITSREVADQLNMDEKEVTAILDELADRGVITKGKTQYCFHSSLIAFHHHTVGGVAREPVPEKIKELWGGFFFNEWCDIFVQRYKDVLEETGRPVHRVWPLTGALELSPNIKPEDIIPEENFKLKLENTKRIIVGHCGCRKNWARCDHPVETCFAPLQGSSGEFFVELPNRSSVREVSLEGALEVVKRNEAAGLVNTGACFCCTCSCEILYSLKRVNRFDLLGKSRYQATVDEEKCIGCQECVERCPFEAVEMKKPAGSKKLKASIDDDKCMGCGVCVVGCEQRALTLELVRPPEYIRSPQPEASQRGVMCKCTQVK